MKAWRVHQLLMSRWVHFRVMRPEEQEKLVELLLTLIAEAKKEDAAV